MSPATSRAGAAAASRHVLRPGWLGVFVETCVVVLRDLALGPLGPAVRADLHQLLHRPVTLYDSHLNWPSAMSVDGPPVEISVRKDHGRPPALRVVADPTDHRFGVVGNWSHYLTAAISLAGTDAELVWSMCRRHLDGVPAGYRSRMLHGVGYGAGGRRRTTFYFRGWDTSADGPPGRLEPHGALAALRRCAFMAGCDGIELYSYDLTGRGVEREKVYGPLTVARTGSLLAGASPGDRDLGAARLLADRLTGDGGIGPPAGKADVAGLLQVSAQAGGDTRTKVYFGCDQWGLSDPTRLARLLHHLEVTMGVDLRPVGTMLDHFIGAGIGLRPTYLACTGPASAADVTMYFAPDALHRAEPAPVPAPAGARPAPRTVSPGDRVRRLVHSGARHLLGQQGRDGMWRRCGRRPDRPRRGLDDLADACTTSLVATALAGLADCADAVSRAGEALERLPAGGWDAQAATVCAGLPAHLVLDLWRWRPGGDRDTGAERCPPPRASGVAGGPAGDISTLRALVASPADPGSSIDRAVSSLLAAQGASGLWEAGEPQDPVLLTACAVEAVLAVRSRYGDRALGAGEVAETVLRARQALRALPVPLDCHAASNWLRAWCAAGGSPLAAAPRRILLDLERTQQDGQWLGPGDHIARRAEAGPGGECCGGCCGGCCEEDVVPDPGCLVTTSSVVLALRRLRAGLAGAGCE